MALARLRLRVTGLVQGVGFRPFVWRLAAGRGLAGHVRNAASGVVVEAEGAEEALAGFAGDIASRAPPLARVDGVGEEPLPPTGERGFRIAASEGGGRASTAVPPDVAACPACLREMRDPADRRHRHPFVNCTDCGPRFTLIEGVPYDRSRTTMAVFPPCPACAGEYADPRSRRFHAEPLACPRCGPRLRLEASGAPPLEGEEALAGAARRLAAGEVVAVKGLGGFHLAVDARREEAVALLRRRKGRVRKPFAVMAADPAAVAAFALLSPEEERLLLSPARPVVLLAAPERRILAPSVAPGLGVAGAMLPYTPLHHLLLEAFAAARGGGGPAVLVMTSANLSGEPIVRGDGEARERLAGLADALLLHDREIHARCDDSVAMVAGGGTRILRRSRGFVPLPVALPASGPPVFAAGGDLKNCFCLTRGGEAFPGPHLGDLGGALAAEAWVEAALRFARLLDVRPALVVHDLHPDAPSARLARELAAGPFGGVRTLGVQHHHAHALSCLAEHGAAGPALGIAVDGAGHGTDGTSWGGEILLVDGARFERLAHLSPLRLPGGDRAVEEVWRLAASALFDLGAAGEAARLARRWPSAPPSRVDAVASLLRGGAPLPLSSSLGRLFDAVAALLGLVDRVSYEGEAAALLEGAAGPGPLRATPYPVRVDRGRRPAILDTAPLLGALLEDVLCGRPAGGIAARFHASVAALFVAGAVEARSRTGLDTVALSGGCLQNRLLLESLGRGLEAAGFRCLLPAAVPANVGGLPLGPALAGVLEEGGG